MSYDSGINVRTHYNDIFLIWHTGIQLASGYEMDSDVKRKAAMIETTTPKISHFRILFF